MQPREGGGLPRCQRGGPCHRTPSPANMMSGIRREGSSGLNWEPGSIIPPDGAGPSTSTSTSAAPRTGTDSAGRLVRRSSSSGGTGRLNAAPSGAPYSTTTYNSLATTLGVGVGRVRETSLSRAGWRLLLQLPQRSARHLGRLHCSAAACRVMQPYVLTPPARPPGAHGPSKHVIGRRNPLLRPPALTGSLLVRACSRRSTPGDATSSCHCRARTGGPRSGLGVRACVFRRGGGEGGLLSDPT